MPTARTMPAARPAWTLSAPAVLADLAVDARAGLSVHEVAERQARHGANELPAAAATPWWRILAAQLANALIVILLIAIALSAVLGHHVEAASIGLIAAFTIVLGFVQELRAERSLDALRRIAAPTAVVVRGGCEATVPARELVPGDVVRLAAGDVVPADARLIEAVELRVNEAALTGESAPVRKQAGSAVAVQAPLGDRSNMVMSSTAITAGRGLAAVVAIGADTEVGRVGSLLRDVAVARSPLERYLDDVGGKLARGALLIVLAVAVAGILRGLPAVDMLIFAIALAVAVVPEALPAVVTICLAIGAQRMARRNALIRRLPVVETLGGTTVICTDKTGTLTTGEMTVRRVFVAGRTVEIGPACARDAALEALASAAALCTDARIVRDAEGRASMAGDPTEGALVTLAARLGLSKDELEAAWPRESEIPFTAESRRMTTIHRQRASRVAFTKGAIEVVLPSCVRWLSAGGERFLGDADRREIEAAAAGMATASLRVLAIARRENASRENVESGCTLLGLVGMADPPRRSSKDAIERCHRAGIRPVMITGDHPATALAIAAELGLARGGDVVTGVELDRWTDEELAERVNGIDVFARVSPEHKLKIVTALQAHGHVVAMTGDGVNDGPALKKADIGIAMGRSGTEVAREASAMILTDDDFASIVAAVEEGRVIFDNVNKFLLFLLTSNIGEIILMPAALLCGLPLPLSAVQVLYVNLATDGLPALALSVDPAAGGVMNRPPRPPGAGLFTRDRVALMLAGGIWSAAANLALFAWALASGHPPVHAMTMTFLCLVLIQFLKAYTFRTLDRPVWVRPFENTWLNAAIAWELALLAAIIYVPFLERLFGTGGLSGPDALITALTALTVVPVLEAVKAWIRAGGGAGSPAAPRSGSAS